MAARRRITAKVATSRGVVPLTLGLRFQRSGSGLAADIAPHYLAAVRDYFAPEPGGLP